MKIQITKTITSAIIVLTSEEEVSSLKFICDVASRSLLNDKCHEDEMKFINFLNEHIFKKENL